MKDWMIRLNFRAKNRIGKPKPLFELEKVNKIEFSANFKVRKSKQI